MTTTKHLIKKPKGWTVEINNNMLQQAAFLAEHNLQASGAVPEKDYNVMDCFLLGAFVYLGSKIDDIGSKINDIVNKIDKITPLDVDIEVDDCVGESKDIDDADQVTPIVKSSFIMGYQ